MPSVSSLAHRSLLSRTPCPSSGHTSLQMCLCRTSVGSALPPWSPVVWATSVPSWEGLSGAWPWLLGSSDTRTLCGHSLDLGWDHLWDPCRGGVGHMPPRWSLASRSQGYSLSPVGFNWEHRDQLSGRQTPTAVVLDIAADSVYRAINGDQHPRQGHKRDRQSAVIHLVEHIPVGKLRHRFGI